MRRTVWSVGVWLAATALALKLTAPVVTAETKMPRLRGHGATRAA